MVLAEYPENKLNETASLGQMWNNFPSQIPNRLVFSISFQFTSIQKSSSPIQFDGTDNEEYI